MLKKFGVCHKTSAFNDYKACFEATFDTKAIFILLNFKDMYT